MRLVCAITGASGSLYGERFVLRALELGAEVFLIVSAAGRRVAREEVGHGFGLQDGAFADRLGEGRARVRVLSVGDIGGPPASGSSRIDGMAIVPCSMGTAGRLAAGSSRNLIERAADVMLKERKPLVLVPRETPLHRIHLRNLLELHDAGAVVLPAMPGFYDRPRTVVDLVDGVVDRALSFLVGPGAVRRPWWPRQGEEGGE